MPKKPANKKKGQRRQPPRLDVRHQIIRNPSLVVPQEMDVVLSYPIYSVLSGAVTDVSRRYTVNAAYDVDPTLGSTSTPGFSEWANFYKFYRVYAYEVDVQFQNADADARTFFVTNSNDDPGTAASGFIDRPSNQFNYAFLCGHTYSDKPTRFRKYFDVARIAGTVAVETDDSYASLASTVPANKIYLAFGAHSNTGTNLTNGIFFVAYVKMHIRFYERVMNLTSMSQKEFELRRNAWKVAQGQVDPGKSA